MISGPVLPRTRAGLFELIERHLDQVESGLTIVATDLELEPGAVVDALAADAAARPVFLFTVGVDGQEQLARRILATRAWLAHGRGMLARACQHRGLDHDQPARFLVLGFDLSAAAVQQLAELPSGAVEVYRLRPFRIASRTLVGVEPLVGVAVDERAGDFRVPAGVADAVAQAQTRRFLELVRCLEPSLDVTGDRYSRVFFWQRELVARLAYRAGIVHVEVPSGASAGEPVDACFELTSDGATAHAVDAVARAYLALAVEPGLQEPGRDETSGPQTSGSLSLEPLRRSVADGQQLTDEECSILG